MMSFSEWLEIGLIVVLVAALVGLAKEIYTHFRQRSQPVKPRATMAEREAAPVVQQDYTIEQLGEYDGEHGKEQVLLAINGIVFDVSASAMYKRGGSYHVFAGHDASRCLAKGSLDQGELNQALEGLQPDELSTLAEWEGFFRNKYVVVGRVVDGPITPPCPVSSSK